MSKKNFLKYEENYKISILNKMEPKMIKIDKIILPEL